MRTNRPIVEKQKLRPNACRTPSAYRSPIISNAHGGMWRTPPAYISAVRFLLDKSKYIADINSSMVPPMGEGHERRAMNVNENLRRQLSCASKRNHLFIAHTPSERKSLKLLVAREAAIEPIPGAFSLKKEYEHMNPRARERARIKAIHKLHPDWTFCLYSAAIAHGLQVPHALLDATHIAIAKGRNWRKAEPTIHSHILHDPITTTSDGVPCTNISATIFECLCATDFRFGLAIVDSALHNHLVSRETLIDYFEQHARYRHGSRQAHMTLMHADGRSENGGESVVRAIILELGFTEPDLQVEIEDPLNPGTYKRVDYYWLLEDGRAIVGELDGFEKYLKTHGNPRKSPDENLRSAIKAMRRERMRETSLNLAGITVLRFSYADALDTEKFFSLLSTAGVPLA